MRNHLFAMGLLLGGAMLMGCSADEARVAELETELTESKKAKERLARELEEVNEEFSKTGSIDAKRQETEKELQQKISQLEQEKAMFLQANKQAALFFQALATGDVEALTGLVDENIEVQKNELLIVKKNRSLEKVGFSGFQEGDGKNTNSTDRFDLAGYTLSEGLLKMEYHQILVTEETYPVIVYFSKKEDGSLKITDMEIEQ